MIQFFIKGLIRDRQRSFLPFLVVSIGVMLTVLMHAWVTGVIGDSIEMNARFESGHVKITTQAWAGNMGQNPLDLALTGTSDLIGVLENEYPETEWVERTRFGGLIDIPDENGETRIQGPVLGMAIDLLSSGSSETERMNLNNALKRGHFPRKTGEVLVSEDMSQKLKINPGDRLTLITTTMYGSMAFYNFTLAGTVSFGTKMLDKGTMVLDIQDARLALDMDDAAGEILGFFSTGFYDKELANQYLSNFNQKYSRDEDPFSPLMSSMSSSGTLALMVEYSEVISATIILLFILVMSVVLWNTGLISGLRRYGEIGVRMAIGENKGHLYRSMISESLVVGVAGSLAGTAIGVSIAFIIQKYGLNFGDLMDDATVMMPSTFRTHVTRATFFSGLIPGVLSTFMGTALSGLGIFKRNTAQLFKELE